MTRALSLLSVAVVLVSLAGCNPVDPTEMGRSPNGLDGDPIAPAPGGGVFTTGCEATCNGSGVICGTAVDPANGQVCCCIGGCTWWAQTCAALVAGGAGGGISPGGGGVFTQSCEDACNGAGVTCGTVANAQGQTCCCIGTCPEWGTTCAQGVASGAFGPGVAPAPGGGVFTQSCEQACNGAGVTCGTVANAQGQTCCCIGTCPQNAQICAQGVGAGVIGPGVFF